MGTIAAMRLALPLVAFGLLLAPSLCLAQPAALSSAARRTADAVPNGRAGTPDRSYVVTNEWGHYLFFPHIESRGGALVGLGSDQLYTLAAAAGSEMIWAVDYDPIIARTHRMYTALFALVDTPEELLALLEEEAEEPTAARLATNLRGRADAEELIEHYRRFRVRLRRYLNNLSHFRLGRTWLNDAGWFAHVRALHRGGRVVARTGDMGGPSTIMAIGNASRELSIPVRVVYLSNAEMFVPNRPQLIANMRNLPTDERSMLLRTLYNPRLSQAPHDHWHYVAQPFTDYLARLGTGHYLYANTIAEDLLRTRRGGDGGFSVLDGSVPMRTD